MIKICIFGGISLIWIDFGIICIGQQNTSTPPHAKDFFIEGCQRTINSKAFYDEYYHFHTADTLLGCWYNVWFPESICYSESLFDISRKDIPYVKVLPQWEKDVRHFLSFYTKESPVHEIAVLLRIQDFSDDVVHPFCNLDDFMQALKNGTVRWNELYYVH